MSDIQNTEIISPIEPTQETVAPATITEAKSQSNPIIAFFIGIFKLLYKLISGIFIGFFKLDIRSKILVIFAFAFFFIGLFIGHTLGFGVGQQNIREDFKQKTNINYSELDAFMRKIDDLEKSLVKIRN